MIRLAIAQKELMKIEECFRGKNVLLTGGIGFIGSNLAEKLVKLCAHVTLVDSLIPEYGGNLFNIEPFRDSIKLVNISDVRDAHSMTWLVKDQDFLLILLVKRVIWIPYIIHSRIWILMHERNSLF